MTAPSQDRIEATLETIRADLERAGPRPEGPVSAGLEARVDNPLDEYVRRRVDELIRAWLRENLHATVRDLLRAELASRPEGPRSDEPT